MKKVISLLAAVTVSLIFASLCFPKEGEQTGKKMTAAYQMGNLASLVNDVSGMMAKMTKG